MSLLISNILYKAKNNTGFYNILDYPTHERYQSNMAKTGHKFFLSRAEGIKDWRADYAPLPVNFSLLPKGGKPSDLFPELGYDFVISHNKAAHFAHAAQLSRYYHVPLVSLEHCLPSGPEQGYKDWHRSMKGHINLFISEYNREQWGYSPEEADVIYHGVDTELFKPSTVARTKQVLSVCNDFINRDHFLGFRLWRQVVEGLPAKVVGDTPGLSLAAPSVESLVKDYQNAQVFLNTSLISPIPSVLMEAMSCGCACVSTDNCAIREFITHGENGLLANSPDELKSYCWALLSDNKLAEQLGENARQTMLKKFSLAKFVENWQKVFDRAANITYTGAV